MFKALYGQRQSNKSVKAHDHIVVSSQLIRRKHAALGADKMYKMNRALGHLCAHTG